MRFEKFKIGDVFEKIDVPKVKAKAKDFPDSWSAEYCVPLLTAGAENQGFARYAKKQDCPMIIKNCLSVSANGANSGIVFYQPSGFTVLQDAYAICVKNHVIANAEEGLYLATVLNKAIRYNHSWVNKAGWNKIKSDFIELPVHESPDPLHVYNLEDINWEYMEQRISELEEQRISELEEYLRVTGLDDYELAEEDKKVLSLSRKSASYKADAMEAGSEDGRIKYKSFTVGELFTSQNGDTDIQKNHITSKGTCVVSSGLEETGIIGKSDVQSRIIPSNTITVDMFGNAFFRDFEYKLVTHARVFSLIPKSFELTRESGLFITALLRWLPKMFSYANMCSFKKIKDFHLFLPVTSDGSIDFDYMQKYIRALEKLTIANVVREKDRIIAETRNIVDTH